MNKYYSEISGAVTLSFEGSIQGKSFHENSLEEYIRSEESADGAIYKQELKDVIRQSIEALSEREQQVVGLYYFEELKQAQIARILGVSEQRISQIISKAIQKIKFTVENYMEES